MPVIVIVGSGVAGTTVARQLLEASRDTRVTMFEAGPDFKTGSHRIWLDHLMADRYLYEPFIDDPRTENPRFGLRGSRLFMKGGTTNHWGGETPRFKPEDFELKSRTGIGADWPITYDELSPYYARAEHALGIEGDSSDDDPPRHGRTYPFPPTPYTLNNQVLMKTLDGLGISYSHMPMARHGDKCITTGTCDYCPVYARYTATTDLMLLQNDYSSRLELRTETPVVRVWMDGKKRARGVEYTTGAGGDVERMEADALVICSGTVESAKLLLASPSAAWPDGIGNDSDHLGRHLVGHPVLSVSGVRPGNPDRIHQELIGIVSLVSRHFDTPEHQRDGKMVFTMSDGSTTPLARHILSNRSRSEIDADVTEGMSLSLGGAIEQFESPENRVRLGGATTRHGLPTTEIDFGVHETTQQSYRASAEKLNAILKAAGCREDSIRVWLGNPDGAHATSTCRMSDSDAEGVVDRDLRVHGTDNLYVCSNAVFPNVAAANPTLTTAALAVRLAEHLDEVTRRE